MPTILQGLGHQSDGLIEEHGIGENGGDVLEYNARLGEIRHIAHGGS